MKKMLVLLVVISVLISACGGGGSSLEYGMWKDTEAAFGNGNYQILHGYRDDTEISILYNCKHKREVVSNVESYVEKDNYVFFVGNYRKKKVLCKLNVETNLLSYYAEETGEEFFMAGVEKLIEDKQIELLSSFDNFSEEDKEILKQLAE